MFQPNSKLRFTRWIIGTGRVNSGWLSIKHAAALTCSTFRKQSSLFEGLFYLYFVFEMNHFFFKMVNYYYVDKTESLSICHIFSNSLFCRQFCRQRACRWRHYYVAPCFRVGGLTWICIICMSNLRRAEIPVVECWVTFMVEEFFSICWSLLHTCRLPAKC